MTLTISAARGRLEPALAHLATSASAWRVRPARQLADAFVRLCADDVVDYARATLTLSATAEAHTAFATARAAYEAGQDALLAACRGEGGYDRAGALAYAASFVETERLRERLRAGGKAYGHELSVAGRRTAADAAEAEAERLDGEHDGSGALLREAFATVLATPGAYRRHWSTKPRNQIGEEIDAATPDGALKAQAMDALYGLLSQQAHPGFKSNARQYDRHDDGTITLAHDGRDPADALRLAELAVILCLDALARASSLADAPPVDGGGS